MPAKFTRRTSPHLRHATEGIQPEAPLGWLVVLLGAAGLATAAEPAKFVVDADIPGGNIVVERVEGDDVYLHQDLRDTRGDWFYYHFRVAGAQDRELRFHFTQSNVIGVRGPAVSGDGGRTWQWLGTDQVEGRTFRYRFRPEDSDVRFCLAFPYLQANLDTFLHAQADNPYLPHLRRETLTRSRKGRAVERLRIGPVDTVPEYRGLITCRHHACEMMASYTLEGILAATLADTDDGHWLRARVELLVVPFMDKDGVEDGDQGKNRRPRDHNRDYAGNSVHPEVAALRMFVPTWSAGRLDFALDLHCPSIRGQSNEHIYFVENNGPTTDNVRRFARLLETYRTGTLPFLAADNLAFGTSWNTAKNYADGVSFSRWAGQLPGTRLATTLEIPYANVRGTPVTADTARELGRDIARALTLFLRDEE